ncbi:DUF805 domain-containing protein [Deinococcus aquiradiocola]|nr:DUF805 domain-containing protein [Deinococcus aquiradiocola]
MTDTLRMVRDTSVEIETLLTRLGAVGAGMGEKAQSLGAALPDDVQRDLKQVSFLRNRVMHDGIDLDPEDERRFRTCAARAVEGLNALRFGGGPGPARAAAPSGWVVPPAPGAGRTPDGSVEGAFASFIDAVTKKYAVFTGRARRREFWMFTLFLLLLTIVAAVLDGILFSDLGDGRGSGPLGAVVSLGLLLPQLGITTRRLHDTGRSGWWQLIAFVPLAGLIVLLVFLATEGTPSSNRWGENPKQALGRANGAY